MRPHIGNHNIVLSHEFPHIIQNLLRLHREGSILCKAFVFLYHFLFQIKNFFRLFLFLTAELYLLQRIGNISDYLYLRLIKHVDMSRPLVDMNDLMLSTCIPFSRSKFDNIIADCNHKVCHIQNLILIILLWNTDRPHGVFIIIRNDSLCHHGIHDRNFQFIRKAGKRFPRMIPHCAVSNEHYRMLGFINHGCCLINAAEGSILFGAYRLVNWLFCKSRSHLHLRYIGRQVNVAGSRLFTLRIFKGNPHDFIDRIRIHNLLAPLRNRSKQFHQIQILMGRQMHPLRSHLSGNCDQRRSVRVCIRGTGNQIGGTRP